MSRKYQLATRALVTVAAGFIVSAALVVAGYAPILTGGEFITGIIGILGAYGASNVIEKMKASTEGDSK